MIGYEAIALDHAERHLKAEEARAEALKQIASALTRIAHYLETDHRTSNHHWPYNEP